MSLMKEFELDTGITAEYDPEVDRRPGFHSDAYWRKYSEWLERREKKRQEYNVIKKLLGPIDPVGETNADDRRYENLKVTIRVVKELLSDLGEVAQNSDRVEYSMKRAGQKARQFLKDIQEWEY